MLRRDPSPSALSCFLLYYSEMLVGSLLDWADLILQEVERTSENREYEFIDKEPASKLKDLDRDVRDALSLYPEDCYLPLLSGMLANKLRHYQDSVKLLTKSFSINPFCLLTWEQLGFAHSHTLFKVAEFFENRGLASGLFCLYLRGAFKVRLAGYPSPSFFANTRFYIYLQTQVLYQEHDYVAAEVLFQRLLHKDPSSLAGIESYSDILFLDGRKNDLHQLLLHCHQKDKFNHVTCYVSGNYYALIGEHEKAAIYFRRAIRLVPQFSSGWILVAQQFIELKQPEAAIDSYKRATGSWLI